MRKGSHMTEEQCANNSAAQREVSSRPEVKERKSAAMKEKWADPEYRERQSAANKKAQGRPEVKEKHSVAAKKRSADPEYRERLSVAHMGQVAWNVGIPRTEAVKAKISAKLIGRIMSEERREQQSVAGKERFLRPGEREKQSEVMKETRARPEVKAIHKAAMNRPEVKERMSKAQKERFLRPGEREKISAVKTGIPSGRKGIPMLEVARVALLASHLGTHLSNETKARIVVATLGALNHGWKGGHRLSYTRMNAQRRGLSSEPIFLNLWVPGKVGHHLDPDQVVFISETLHTSVSHNVWTGKNMEQINALAMQEAGLSSVVLDDTLPFN